MKKGILFVLLTICLVLFISTSAMAYWVNPFSDVDDPPDEEWFYDAVGYNYENGIMLGTSPTTFSPNSPVTRGQVVTVLYRMEEEPGYDTASPFTDLTQDWYKDAVHWAYENEIVFGYTATIFGPDDVCTREQFVTILYRYADYAGEDISTDPRAQELLDAYGDAGEVSAWVLAAVLWGLEDGYIQGYSEEVLDPKGTLTRAQMAQIVMMYMQGFDMPGSEPL